jgi:hypothetical protein
MRGQGGKAAAATTTCTSAESGNDHDGRSSCHRDRRRDRPRALREVGVEVYCGSLGAGVDDSCIGLGDGGRRRVALTDVARSYCTNEIGCPSSNSNATSRI